MDIHYSVSILIIFSAHSQTVNLSGNQTVAEETNVTFTCTVDTPDRQLRSNWFLIFPDDRVNIRLQGGSYIPNDTDRSLFHVPDIFPGLQEEFTFVRISPLFDMVQVDCFNGGGRKSSFINVIRKLFVICIDMYIYVCTIYTRT